MTRTILTVFLTIILIFNCLRAQNIFVQYDQSNIQAAYAAKKLSEVLKNKSYNIVEIEANPDFQIVLEEDANTLGAEAFKVTAENGKITVTGGDKRGLIYGGLALAEKVKHGESLKEIVAFEEKPYLQFRGIKYNLPWETYRPSNALTQHTETAKDLKYWEAFLDMMVENRFNAISLWNLHPYSFMIRPKNFPKACPWSDEELAEWQKLYKGIFSMAKERGLDTYIVHWSIFVSQAFAENYHAAEKNFYPAYYVEGDTSAIVKKYFKESVKQLLEEYPDLDGIGISHGEGMAGMTPLQRQKWMDDVLIAGMMEVDRPVKLIHRVPFSSGLSSDPGVSKNVEVVTRDAMERLGNKFEGPIWVEIKFNWSHAHSTPKLEKVHGGALGDTYFKPTPTNYKITWQARNEDFFALRWGVPSFIRKHIELNTGQDYVGGYFIGSETYIPALDYFSSVPHDQWKWAFERQWLFYKLWGRLEYDPKTKDEVFAREFKSRYGAGTEKLLEAYELASKSQLRLASLYDSRWDFTLYSEGFLALQGDTTKYISVDQLIQQKTMASEYVSILDYVHATMAGKKFDADRMTPDKLADLLEKDNRRALMLVNGIKTNGNTALMYEVNDVKIWANLGLHLAEKIRGGIALETYRKGDGKSYKNKAVKHLKNALKHWDTVISISRPIYKDMPLTHYNHNFFYPNENNLFHWALIRNEVANDIRIAQNSKVAYH